MLTQEENDFLTRVGPGTPGGEWLRQLGGVAEYVLMNADVPVLAIPAIAAESLSGPGAPGSDQSASSSANRLAYALEGRSARAA